MVTTWLGTCQGSPRSPACALTHEDGQGWAQRLPTPLLRPGCCHPCLWSHFCSVVPVTSCPTATCPQQGHVPTPHTLTCGPGMAAWGRASGKPEEEETPTGVCQHLS